MAMNWLPLTEYSSKYRVSISTLRRRIKADDIKCQLVEGRYLILDQPQEHRPSQGNFVQNVAPPLKKEATSQKNASVTRTGNEFKQMAEEMGFEKEIPNVIKDEPILTAANRLLSELKKAYTQILQEKEEQILHLKEEVSDLKTLVRVLESENNRLNGQ